jgi:hypothetical protein
MQDHRDLVGRDPDVELQGVGALREALGKGEKGVFREFAAGAPVGYNGTRSGIEQDQAARTQY